MVSPLTVVFLTAEPYSSLSPVVRRLCFTTSLPVTAQSSLTARQNTKGALYGTTAWGGAYNRGTVFKVSQKGNETVLHSFRRGADGGWPNAVIRDSQGNLYGTTLDGGPFGNGCCGTVFKLDPTGKKKVLYNFTGKADGEYPYAGVIRDSMAFYMALLKTGAISLAIQTMVAEPSSR